VGLVRVAAPFRVTESLKTRPSKAIVNYLHHSSSLAIVPYFPLAIVLKFNVVVCPGLTVTTLFAY